MRRARWPKACRRSAFATRRACPRRWRSRSSRPAPPRAPIWRRSSTGGLRSFSRRARRRRAVLNDLTLAPSQACGAFRLVPLLRKAYRTDLRLGLSKESGFAVELSKTVYTSYIPHALVLEWGDGAQPFA